MERLKVIPTTPAVLRQRHAAASFKVCPLCDGLNLRENDECYVCRWSGEFETGPAVVSAHLNAMIERCPELATICGTRKVRPWDGLVRAWRRFKGLFRRRVDYRI